MLNLPNWAVPLRTLRVEAEKGATDLAAVSISRAGRGAEGDEGAILWAQCEGDVGRDGMTAALQALSRTEGFRSDIPALWDMRANDFSVARSEDVQAIALAVGAVTTRKGVRRAFLVSTDIGFGVFRMLQSTIAGFHIDAAENFLVTRDLDTAVDWLLSRSDAPSPRT